MHCPRARTGVCPAHPWVSVPSPGHVAGYGWCRTSASMGGNWIGAPGWALCATMEVWGTEFCCPCASRHHRQALCWQPTLWAEVVIMAPAVGTVHCSGLLQCHSTAHRRVLILALALTVHIPSYTSPTPAMPRPASFSWNAGAQPCALGRDRNQVGNSSGFNKYILTPIHWHHKLCEKPGRDRVGAVNRGQRDFTLCTTWARCPPARGSWSGRAVGAPTSMSPGTAHWHKWAGPSWHCSCAEMGCPGWGPGHVHPAVLLCAPHPARAGAIRSGAPLCHQRRCVLALLWAEITAQWLRDSTLASWTFSRASEGASRAGGGKWG